MPVVAALILASSLCIAHVHDGDTLRTCAGERVRLIGIDAPEVRGSPRCSAKARKRLALSKNRPWCDFAAGDASKNELRRFLRLGRVSIERAGNDVYGRTLAHLQIGRSDAGDHLIDAGLARRWR